MSESLHEHGHSHEHCHCDDTTPEEIIKLLQYMLDHNRHHADELHDMAHSLSNEARELVHAAVIDLEKGNDKLAKAIGILTKTED